MQVACVIKAAQLCFTYQQCQYVCMFACMDGCIVCISYKCIRDLQYIHILVVVGYVCIVTVFMRNASEGRACVRQRSSQREREPRVSPEQIPSCVQHMISTKIAFSWRQIGYLNNPLLVVNYSGFGSIVIAIPSILHNADIVSIVQWRISQQISILSVPNVAKSSEVSLSCFLQRQNEIYMQ